MNDQDSPETQQTPQIATESPTPQTTEKSSRPPTTPTPVLATISSKTISFSFAVKKLIEGQEKRDKADTEKNRIATEIGKLQTILTTANADVRTTETDVHSLITAFDFRDIQEQLVVATEAEAEIIRKSFSDVISIAAKSGHGGVRNNAESFLKTGEAFRFAWQQLTADQIDDRGLEPIVSSYTAKPFHRALKSYKGVPVADKFLEMIPKDWRPFIEWKSVPTAPIKQEKVSVPAAEEPKTI